MTNPIPTRSTRGCLTCKQRRKKCDEKKPQCNRCLRGDFDCLGYEHLAEGYTSASTSNYKRLGNEVPPLDTNPSLDLQFNSVQLSMSVDPFLADPSLPLIGYLENQLQPNTLSLAYLHKLSLNIPTNPQLGLYERDNMVDLISSQFLRLVDRVPFRPFPFAFHKAIVNRAQKSNLILKTMYLGARIIQALLDNTNRHSYVGWINDYHLQISGTELITTEVDVTDLADRLSAHHDLAFYAFMLLGSQAGYSLLRKCVPLFLQLAARTPQVWTQESTISISHVLNPTRHEIARLVLSDTILAMVFGTAPLLKYDTTIHEDELENRTDGFLERVYSCPVVILVLLARINSARVARLMDQRSPNPGDIQAVESLIKYWDPMIDYTDNPAELVARLAIQECWRQAALVYLYMGTCEADSADERIRRLVSQVAQLASTIEAGSPFDAHLSVPCLIAGVAARKESHRAIFRGKILASQNIDARLLSGADFVLVLDHLWHGAAAGGNPVTWEDYVDSRYMTMPVDA